MDLKRLKSQIVSILFVAPKPVTMKELLDTLETDEEEIRHAIGELVQENSNSGVIVLAHNDRLQLSTNPDNSPAVKKYLSLELREKLTDAALETLAIIVYRQPVSKAEIENIRGVNSQYILRQLLIRGLIEKTASTQDRRQQLYKTTLEFMQHLGISDMKELPDFEELTKSIQLPDAETTDSPAPAAPEQPASASKPTPPNPVEPDSLKEPPQEPETPPQMPE